jgi:hypothetical protein
MLCSRCSDPDSIAWGSGCKKCTRFGYEMLIVALGEHLLWLCLLIHREFVPSG